MEFTCIFAIDIEAESREEAAAEADKMIRSTDPEAWEEGRFYHVIPFKTVIRNRLFDLLQKCTKLICVPRDNS